VAHPPPFLASWREEEIHSSSLLAAVPGVLRVLAVQIICVDLSEYA
jgi:hypothetical protein